MLTGGCLCGAIRYQAGGQVTHRTACHCSLCRHACGAPLVSWFTVPRAQFVWLQGSPGRFQSSVKACRSFCTACGTQLTFDDSDWLLDVTMCSLDDPNAMAPEDHIHVGSKLDWIKLADGLPQYRASRGEG